VSSVRTTARSTRRRHRIVRGADEIGPPERESPKRQFDAKEAKMIRSGDTIHNPVTGERITFHQTSADTNGEAVVIECTVQPDGFVAAAHLHPSQTERFAIIGGRLGMKVGRKKLLLERGDVAVVGAGTSHKFWNMGDDEVRFVCEVRPALQFESLLETMFALAADGKTNKKGMPNPPSSRVPTSTQCGSRSRPRGCSARVWRSARRSGGCSGTPRRTSRRAANRRSPSSE
jgi:mannose-6-phosphate isomerase-like protein (cupin superfamily)